MVEINLDFVAHVVWERQADGVLPGQDSGPHWPWSAGCKPETGGREQSAARPGVTPSCRLQLKRKGGNIQ
jgi:hypothetical protein